MELTPEDLAEFPLFPGLREQPIPGKTLVISGALVFMPPMRLRDLKAVASDGSLQKIDVLARRNIDDAFDPAEFEEGMKAAVSIIHHAMRRNYPQLTKDEIDDFLDVGNMPAIMEAVLAANGLESRPRWPKERKSPPAPEASRKAAAEETVS